MDLINGNLSDEAEMNNRAAFFGVTNPLRLAMNIWMDNLTAQNNFRSELEKQIVQRQVTEMIEQSLSEWPQHFFLFLWETASLPYYWQAEDDVDDTLLKSMAMSFGG